MQFKDKTILIISPQPWGIMKVAKHHYAMELAKKGANVFFLSTPTSDCRFIQKGFVHIENSEIENLKIIEHQLFFSYKIKFKFEKIFLALMQVHINKIIKKIDKKIDIVWSFDLGNFFPFKLFKNTYNIYMPVDEPLNKNAFDSGIGANIVFSITKEIVDKYKSFLNVPSFFINHGVSDAFLNYKNTESQNENINVGISGNFLRPDIDYPILLKIIDENPSIIFHCYGQTKINQTNYTTNVSNEIVEFIERLGIQKNVVLYGPCNQEKLIEGLNKMDAFLICYDILKDQSKGTNYHKVMEYLSTGKVIISNNITTYSTMSNLIYMNNSRNNNKELPQLFNQVMSNLTYYNKEAFISLRKQFAFNNAYSKKMDEVEYLISHSGTHS
jgi:glycosyltransferase involved in cell wall biosynthesis